MDDAIEFDFFEFLRCMWRLAEIKNLQEKIDDNLRLMARPWPGLDR